MGSKNQKSKIKNQSEKKIKEVQSSKHPTSLKLRGTGDNQNGSEEGLVYVFTGEGKGKTSAAIGTVVRAVGVGMKAAWVAWYKQASWGLSEMESLEKLGVEVYLMGEGFRIKNQKSKIKSQNKNSPITIVKVKGGGVVVDTASEREHMKAAKAALRMAAEQVGKVDMLVLDEVNNAVFDGLIDRNDLIHIISNRGKTHLVLTGRNAQVEVIEAADLVTEMKKVKHPYDQGKLAVRGLDF